MLSAASEPNVNLFDVNVPEVEFMNPIPELCQPVTSVLLLVGIVEVVPFRRNVLNN